MKGGFTEVFVRKNGVEATIWTFGDGPVGSPIMSGEFARYGSDIANVGGFIVKA